MRRPDVGPAARVLRAVPAKVRGVFVVAVIVLVGLGAQTEQVISQGRDLVDGVLGGGPGSFGSEASATSEAAGPAAPLDQTDAPRADESPDVPGAPLSDVIAALEVDDVGSPTGGYDRSVFPHWTDVSGTGCHARQDVLQRDFVDATVEGCAVVPGSGSLTSLWDGQELDDPAQVDVDHIRALADAWGANASTWTLDEREVFANDPYNLVAVSASSNRSKGAHGPDRWTPDNEAATCWYVDRYARVSDAYGLSVTTSQHSALTELAATCG